MVILESFTPFLTILSVVVPLSVCSVLIARIYRKNAALDPKITQKLRKQTEEYVTEVERKNRQLQNKMNSMNKGPTVSEDDGLPDIIDAISPNLPKWASSTIKQLKNNPDILNMLKDYVKNNPEQASKILEQLKTKFIAKSKPQAGTPDGGAVQGL